ncbi:MAG: DUF4175 family protein, partial [Planctomycetota bacterium]|nr:DUF4175 family protein [Planctomycetota bacterium]
MTDPGPALNELFARLERRYYHLLAWHGIASIFLMLAATAAISFILDSVFELDKWLRVAVIILAVALWVRVLLQGRRRLRSALSKEDLLAAVENSSEDLEGELANIVELRRELAAGGKGAEPRTGLEQELFDRALRESQKAVSALEVGAVLDSGSVRRNQLAAVAAVLFLVFCGLLFPAHAGLWVQRNIALSSVHWPRATHFFLESSGKVDHPRKNRLNLRAWVTGAPRGGDVFIVINSESGIRKSRLLLEIPEEPAGKLASEVVEGGPDSTPPFKASRLNYTIPNVLESFEFYFVGGDNRSTTTWVSVHDKPRIVSSRLRVRAPEHTGRGEQEVPNPTGEVEVIAGSKVIFEGSCDREIRKAWGRFGEDEQSEADLSAKDGFSYSFAVESSAFLEVGVEGAQWGFDSEQVRLAMVAVPDAQPEIELKIAGEAREVTPEGRIEYTLRASDDFGFSQLQLLIDGLQAVDLEDGKPKPAKLPPWKVVRTEEGVVVEIAASLELASLALEPGMNISFRGLVRDNDAPGGYKESSSEEITFAVVSARKLKENLDKVRVKAQERLEELTFREGALVKELLRLQEELSDPPPVSAGGEGRPGEIAAGAEREEGSREAGEDGEQEPVELALAEPSEAGNPAEGGRNPGGRPGRTSQGGRQAPGRQGQNEGEGEQPGENASEEPGEGEEPGEREPRAGEEPGENEENGESEPGRGQQQAGSRQGGRQGQSGQSSQGRQGQAGEEGDNQPEDGEEGENEPGERSGEEEENSEEPGRQEGEQPRTEQGESETPESRRNSAGTGRRSQEGQQGRQQQGQQGRQQEGQQGLQQQGQQGRQQ